MPTFGAALLLIALLLIALQGMWILEVIFFPLNVEPLVNQKVDQDGKKDEQQNDGHREEL